MNRLTEKLQKMKKVGRKALVTYLTAGYPTAAHTEELALLFEKNGADVLEIGIPFSDPIADGKSVQYASQVALCKGMSLDKVYNIVSNIRKKSEIPIVLMGYLNPFMRHGLKHTLEQAKKCGADALIIPDIIPEQSADIRKLCTDIGLSLVYLAAPNTPVSRLKSIDTASDGFVYIVSIAGVTGARKDLPSSTVNYLKNTAKEMHINSRIIGFGISSPAQIKELKMYVDGFIVASALIEIIRKSKTHKIDRAALSDFIRSLRKEMDR
jgi:tryptophan synthase alpha chain